MSRKIATWGALALILLFGAENLLGLSFDSASVVLAAALVYVTTVYARSTERMARSSAAQVRELKVQTEQARKLAQRQIVATAWSDVWAAHEDIADAKLALESIGELEGMDKASARKSAFQVLRPASDALKARHNMLASIAAGLPSELEEPVIMLARDLLHLRGACILVQSTVIEVLKPDNPDEKCSLAALSTHWMTSERDKLEGSPVWEKVVSGEYADKADKAHDVAWEALYDWLHQDAEEASNT